MVIALSIDARTVEPGLESHTVDRLTRVSGPGGQGQPRSGSPIQALLVGNFISDLGHTFSSLAIPWFVLATGGGGGKVALTVAVGTIPYVLVGIFGGAIVDRIGPKRAAVLSDALSGISTALIPLLHAIVASYRETRLGVRQCRTPLGLLIDVGSVVGRMGRASALADARASPAGMIDGVSLRQPGESSGDPRRASRYRRPRRE